MGACLRVCLYLCALHVRILKSNCDETFGYFDKEISTTFSSYEEGIRENSNCSDFFLRRSSRMSIRLWSAPTRSLPLRSLPASPSYRRGRPPIWDADEPQIAPHQNVSLILIIKRGRRVVVGSGVKSRLERAEEKSLSCPQGFSSGLGPWEPMIPSSSMR